MCRHVLVPNQFLLGSASYKPDYPEQGVATPPSGIAAPRFCVFRPSLSGQVACCSNSEQSRNCYSPSCKLLDDGPFLGDISTPKAEIELCGVLDGLFQGLFKFTYCHFGIQKLLTDGAIAGKHGATETF